MILYGGGGHAKVVFDCLQALGLKLTGVFDDQAVTGFFEDKYLGKYSEKIFPNSKIIIAIGNNKTRKLVAQTVSHIFGKIAHPCAIVSNTSQIGEGCVVFHQAMVQANVVVGKLCIINTASIIEHDCVLEDFVHIATRATLCGGVHIGEGSLVGAAATILPGITVGKWCIIGAGSVVTKNIPDYCVVAGVPSRFLRLSNE